MNVLGFYGADFICVFSLFPILGLLSCLLHIISSAPRHDSSTMWISIKQTSTPELIFGSLPEELGKHLAKLQLLWPCYMWTFYVAHSYYTSGGSRHGRKGTDGGTRSRGLPTFPGHGNSQRPITISFRSGSMVKLSLRVSQCPSLTHMTSSQMWWCVRETVLKEQTLIARAIQTC